LQKINILKKKDFILKVSDLSDLDSGTVQAKVPSNIALVKYWGKKKNQIPTNTSISFTLSACFTLTKINFRKKLKTTNFDFEIYFEGKKQENFKPKIKTFFKRIEKYVPFIRDYFFEIHSRNSFPHSSGIASSASGMGALALCIMQMEKMLNPNITEDYFNKKASFLARLGSGSASRSIEKGIVVWGKHKKIKNSSNLYAIKFPYKVHSVFNNYHDTILLVDKGEKTVSSTLGHQLMENHPFAKQRFLKANKNISKLKKALKNGDIESFINITESEALTLHGLMMSSNPYFILIKPNTLKIINKIWNYRQKTNIPISFTLDAGANVHVLYPENYKTEINDFIISELIEYCQNNSYICDKVTL
jgi:diphosphomevalonate decarboxylase